LKPYYPDEEEDFDDMKAWKLAWHRWWRQRALWGAEMAMRKDNLWGLNALTFKTIGDAIGPFVENGLIKSGRELRLIKAQLHTDCIDELTSDLLVIQETIKKRQDITQRTLRNYNAHESRDLHHYLALSTGQAITPQDAWHAFHATALATADALADMIADEDPTDFNYYTTRYQSVFQETFVVYQLFVRLVDLKPLELPTTS
jgi:hypothetical protein